MARLTLPKLFRSMAFDRRHFGRNPHRFRLFLEHIEDRINPSTLPPPTVLSPTATASSVAAAAGFNPQVVADPNSPLDQVLVATTGTGTSLSVIAQYSTDGGGSWAPLVKTIAGVVVPFDTINTAVTLAAPSGYSRPVDPSQPLASPKTPYAFASEISVAFGADGTVYYTYLVHNADKTSGAVVFRKGNFGDYPSEPQVVYRWDNADPANNPIIAVDNNTRTYTDPETLQNFGPDSMVDTSGKSKAVYIAWNGNASAAPGDVKNAASFFNPNPILFIASGDDGTTWSNPSPVSDGGYLVGSFSSVSHPDGTGARAAAPQIVFSPINSSDPGTMVIVWPRLDGKIITEGTQQDDGVVSTKAHAAYTVMDTFGSVSGKIPDGVQPPASPPPPPNTPDAVGTKTFDLTVTAGDIADPNFTLQDLSVELSLVSSHLDHLEIDLIAPNGNSITLLNNRLDDLGNAVPTPAGQPFAPGLPPPPAITIPEPNPNPYEGLGVVNGFFGETVFSDTAARRINDPASTFPYIGTFRPENDAFSSEDVPSPQFISTLNLTTANIIGTWHLTVTDFRDDRYKDANSVPYEAAQFLEKWGLTFSSIQNDLGNDSWTGLTGTTIGTDFNNSPNKPAISPTAGIAGSVSAAFDTSLGSYSTYGGDLYLAYTTGTGSNTDIDVARFSLNSPGSLSLQDLPSKVNDDALGDNYTEGNRAQFIPAIAVDPLTGTVVATWYDARLDANNTRAATFVSTSIDGGDTWSDQTFTTSGSSRPFLSQPKDATDIITGTTYTLQPVPTNVPLAGTDGLGIRQSVIAYNGHIYAYWAGNSNAAGVQIMSAEAVTAVGPRVVSGDMGPVPGNSLSSFTLSFDREIDPETISPSAWLPNQFYATGDLVINGGNYYVAQSNGTSALAGGPTGNGVNILDGSILWNFTLNPFPVTVLYHNPYDPLPGFVSIPITSITRLNATDYQVNFPTQTAVGTYSYSVSSTIRDRLRSPVISKYIAKSTGPTSYPAGGFFSPSITTASAPIPLEVPAGETITGVTASFTIQQSAVDKGFPTTVDLRVTLISPTGTRITLADNSASSPNAPNFISTGFSDTATFSIDDFINAKAPYTGVFQPADPLSALDGEGAIGSGFWHLEIQNDNPGGQGVLETWSVAVQLSTPYYVSQNPLGNMIDQNANAKRNEANVDSFSIPAPLSGVPFTAPYDSTTLPLIITGPHMTGSSVPNGGSATDPSLVLAGVATAVDVSFDRPMNTDSAAGPAFSASNIIRITGPTGVIYDRRTGLGGPVTVKPLGVTAPTPATQFEIGFPSQILTGSYSIEVDPEFASATPLPGGTLQTRPALVDTNLNAGLDVLRGTASPTSGTPASLTYNASFNGAAAVIPAAVDGIPGTIDFPLSVPDSYVIALSSGHQVQVQLNVSSAIADSNRVVDLVADLIAPNGKTVRLFSNVGQVGRTPGTLWFSNTLFDDTSDTPVQSGFQPFDSGPYNPQFPLGDFAGINANGGWILRLYNSGAETPNLTSWSLTLPKISPGTGLGEPNADNFTIPFRIFNQDPTNRLTQDVWTPVGPASENGGGNSARTNAIAVDPSDPSGNTVYLGAASGGLWKTTNFLTTDAAGPTWQPLGDSAPTFGLNVESIAVFPRNNDPSQSIIFALTGEGDTFSSGVGVLRSMDGGKTWVVLDSTNNTDSPTVGTGQITSIDDTADRDRVFFGMSGFKIIVDPTAVNDADKDVIVYLAGSRGVWRSTDTGRHWTKINVGGTGVASDITLAPGSAATSGTPNLQILYIGIYGSGVFMANPAYAVTNAVQLLGTPTGNGSFVDGDQKTNPTIPIAASSTNPNGNAKGRVVLATPALTNNALRDLNYQGWLYALVSTPGGALDGLYMTKDFGHNWTRVGMPEYIVGPNGYGTNDYTQADHDPFPAQGLYNIAIAIDPNNPNVVYLGGTTADGALPPNGGLVRVDTTGLLDAGAVVAYDNGFTSASGAVQFTTNSGNITVKAAGGPYGINGVKSQNVGLLNVLRDPTNPFVAGSQITFTNVVSINNQGWGSHYSGFPSAEVQTDIHRIIAIVDPATGKTRVIVGDDQGIASSVDDGAGNELTSIGTLQLPGEIRNGNLQTVQFYSSTTHPGQLAIEIAQAMFYGMAQDDGFPISNPDILQTGVGTAAGKLSWDGITGDGSWLLTDQTGSGTSYQYRWPCCGNDGLPAAEFFRVTPPGTGPSGIGRTLFLVQPDDNPAGKTGQWPTTGGSQFAVNPIDGNGIMMSSSISGRLFRTVDQGKTWFQVAGPDPGANSYNLYQNLGGYAPALAFGSPETNNPNLFNNFLYAGTMGGKVWVSFDGGGSWNNITLNIGGGIQQIVPDPVRGTHDLYVVTSSGVYYKADSRDAVTNWVNITGAGANSIFALSRPIFGEANAPPPPDSETRMMRSLTSLAVDWRYAIPVDPLDPSKGTYPVLYVGGDGGIARSVNDGQSWEVYPSGTTYTYTDPQTGNPASVAIPPGGYFPSVQINQLTLSLGNIDPNTGQPLQQTGGLNMLTAGTYGRGTWVIRLGTPDNDPEIASIAQYQVVKQSGPRVIGVTVTQQPTGATNAGSMDVEFNAPVLASSFDASDIQLFDSDGTPFTITGITPIVNSTAPQAFPTVPGNPADYHNLFRVTFESAAASASGFGQIVIGPNIGDYAGFLMNQDDDFTNGELTPDPNNGGYATDAYHGYVYFAKASGGSTTLSADFSNGSGGLSLDGFSATNLWHATSTAPGATDPGHTAPEIAYFGIDAQGNYNTGEANMGDLTSRPFIASASTVFDFNYQLNTEYPESTYPPDYDFAEVQVTADGGVTWTTVAANTAGGGGAGGIVNLPEQDTNPGWAPISIPLSVYAGQTLQVRFHFESDGFDENYLGWEVDDVAISNVTLPGRPGNLYIDQPTVTRAGDPTRVVISSFDPGSGLPDASYRGTINLTATIDGKAVVLTDMPVVGIDSVSEDALGNVTVTTHGPVSYTVGQSVIVGGIATVGYNGTYTVTSVSASGFTYVDPILGLAPDILGGNVTGPIIPVAAKAGTPAPAPSDPLPTTYKFTAADAGTHVFTLFYLAASSPPDQTLLTVTDTLNSTNPAQAYITVTPGRADHFVVRGLPDPFVAGTVSNYTVDAVDPYGNIDPTYDGTVTITTTDPLGTLSPTTYTFTTGAGMDNGVHLFTGGAQLETAGLQSVTVTDATNPLLTLTGTETVLVVPATPSVIKVTGFPSPTVAGVSHDFTVSLFDPYGNLATNYTGTVTLSSFDDPQATFSPGSYTFTSGVGMDNGTHVFTNGATLKTAGLRSITVTDLSLALSGVQSGITVVPAPTSQFILNYPSPVTAGTSHGFSVRASDPYGNTTPTYTGTVTLSSSDPQAVFAPPTLTFGLANGGVKSLNGTLKTSGTQSITATDGTFTGTENVLVNPAAAFSVVVSGFPTPDTAGVAHDFTVTLKDAYGNVATGYTGTMKFTTDDPLGSFTTSTYSFLPADAGTHTFTLGATLEKAGTWAITAADTVNAALVGSETGIVVNAAAASSATVTGFPSPVVPGVAHDFTVTLFDPFGNVATGYGGTMNFTSDDPQASFSPGSYAFTPGDAGTHTFTGGATLKTTGTWKITADDGTIPGSETGIVVTQSAPAEIDVTGYPTSVVAGSANSFTVTVKDGFGNIATNYAGTITLTSSDTQANFAGMTYTFDSGVDMGVHTFTNEILKTAGVQSITASDLSASLSGSETGITVSPAALSTFTIGFPTPVTAGTAHSFTVAASDPYGNTITSYTGNVTVSTLDPLGSFATATQTFAPADNGVKTFTGTLETAGTQSISATDGTLSGTESGIQVVAAAASSIDVTGFPATVVAGTAHDLTVTLKDPFGNVATGYTGTISLSSSDLQGTFGSSPYVFTATDAGTHTFTGDVVLRTAGTQSINATDGALTGSETGILVTPAAASRIAVTGFPNPTTAGDAHDVTITLQDPFGNTDTNYVGTVTLSSTDSQASFVANSYGFTAADAGVHTLASDATLKTAGTWSIDATDGTISGSESGIVVTPAPTSQFLMTFPSLTTAGTTHSFTVTAADAYGNTTPSFTGSVALSSSDPLASFTPNPVVFAAADNGVETVSGTLDTAGSQSITATIGAITGTQNGITVKAAAASSLGVSGFPSPDTAGDAHDFTVTFFDPFGNVATGYLGTITVASTDPLATFASGVSPYIFTASDAGTHTFTNGATLRKVGTWNISATDGTLSGAENGIQVVPAATSQFLVSFPSSVTAGQAESFTVTAADAYGNTTPTYTGNVQLTSSDSQASFSPNPATFSAADNGQVTLTGTLKTAGSQSVTANDGTFTGTQSGITVTAAAATTVLVTGYPSPDTAGVSHNFTITLKDPYGNVATGYRGTVTLSSSDPQATFAPTASPYTFTAIDSGTHTFVNGLTLKTAGTQSITATDGTLTGSQTGITVNAAAASVAIVSGFPTSTTAGVAHDLTVTLNDPYGNVATGYTGTITLSSGDPQAAFSPTTYSFQPTDAGVHTFAGGATLKTVGTWSITAADGGITGSETGIAVTPAATSQFLIGFPNAVVAGDSHGFTVTAADAFGNTTPTYTGSVTLSSSDANAAFTPTTISFAAADNGVKNPSGILKTSGTQSITAGDGVLSGTENGIVVTAAAASSMDVAGFPATTTAGVPHGFTVTLHDVFGNVATGYLGTMTFSSDDPQATFAPTSYAFTAADAGTHTFPNGATLKTTGTWSLHATDGTLAGTESGIVVNPAAASTLTISGFPGTVQAEVPHPFTVTLTDPFGNIATGYLGAVTITSPDPLATFSPNPYTFTAADAGVHQFSADLQTPGTQSFTVHDVSIPTLTDTESGITVTPAAVISFTLSGAPNPAIGGTPFGLQIQALDTFGRLLTTYNGAVTFSSSDPYAQFPSGFHLANGVGTANVTLFTPSTRSITVADAIDPSATGTTNVNVSGGQLQPALVTGEFAVGSGSGQRVSLYNAGGTKIAQFTPFAAGNGVRTVVADFNLDGTPDIAFGTGPGTGAEIKVVDGKTGTVLFDAHPFLDPVTNVDFTGGVFVAAGNVTGDGYPDLIVTPDEGGGPRVSIFHGGDFTKIADFFGIADPNFRGGARASAGDINADGYDDVVISAGFGGGPRISIFDGQALSKGQETHPVPDFFAFADDLRDGVYVAVGDINGDGNADLVFGAGPGGGPRTEVLSGKTVLASGTTEALIHPIANFFTGDYSRRGGIREAIKNLDGDNYADLIVGDGDSAGTLVRTYKGVLLTAGNIGADFAFDAFPGINSGVFVG